MAKLVQGQGSIRKRIRQEAEEPRVDTEIIAIDSAAKDTHPKKRVRKVKGAKGSSSSSTDKNASDDVDNVVYLGHIPSGFFETEIRNFFSQFGKVRRIKLFRSKKTGNSKGYAFVQFETMDVATIAAEAMDGYMFGDRKLVAHVVQKDKCHSGMFLPYKEKVPRVTKDRSDETEEETVKREYSKVLRSEKKKMKKIQASGLEFFE